MPIIPAHLSEFSQINPWDQHMLKNKILPAHQESCPNSYDPSRTGNHYLDSYCYRLILPIFEIYISGIIQLKLLSNWLISLVVVCNSSSFALVTA